MTYQVDPIGIFHCQERYRFDTPRQGAFAHNKGVIILNEDHDYASCASDLTGFDRIWVIFLFHLNQTWNPKVTPPIAPPGRKIGVFATRSPHRPHRIGLSCVELEKVEQNKIFIKNFDLLDLTPIIDIKPYIPQADAFPDSQTGWLQEVKKESYTVNFTSQALIEFEQIQIDKKYDLVKFCNIQLSVRPLDVNRKKLQVRGEKTWTIEYRKTPIEFDIDHITHNILVKGIYKG